MASLTALGEHLRTLRQGRGLSLRAAAGLTGVPFGTLARLERGEGGPPSFLLLQRLAAGYGVEPDALAALVGPEGWLRQRVRELAISERLYYILEDRERLRLALRFARDCPAADFAAVAAAVGLDPAGLTLLLEEWDYYAERVQQLFFPLGAALVAQGAVPAGWLSWGCTGGAGPGFERLVGRALASLRQATGRP